MNSVRTRSRRPTVADAGPDADPQLGARPPSTTRAPAVGDILSERYRLVRLIGKGGMAMVYEAVHTWIGRRVAVKFPRSDLVSEPGVLACFRREARVAGALESEHVASVVDFGYAPNGTPFLVMEYLVGEDLSRLIEREAPLPVRRAVSIVVQACRGLEAAHAIGIVHRDMKPENLFLAKHDDGSELVKILDFGIAKMTGEAWVGPDGPPAGGTMGTPQYMAPEQARSAEHLDQRADVFALGTILFEALTRKVPHPGDSLRTILRHLQTQRPTPIESLRSGLPLALIAVIRRALATAPRDRYPTAASLAADLTRFERPPRNGTSRSTPPPSLVERPIKSARRTRPLGLGPGRAAALAREREPTRVELVALSRDAAYADPTHPLHTPPAKPAPLTVEQKTGQRGDGFSLDVASVEISG